MKYAIAPLPLPAEQVEIFSGVKSASDIDYVACWYSMPRHHRVKAHQAPDRAVDAAYGKAAFKTEAERVAFLFERYQQLTAPLALVEKAGKNDKRKRTKCTHT